MKHISASLVHLLLCIVVFLATSFVSAAVAATTSNTAPSQQVQAVQTLEDTLFAVHYDQDALDARVSRLEETVFGQAQTGSSLDARISKLKSALSPSALGPLSPTAKTTASSSSNASPANDSAGSSGSQQTPKAQNTASPKIASSSGTSRSNAPQSGKSFGNYSASPAPEPGETDYPTVSQMEQKLFGKTYVHEDITLRLNRLEKEVFKTVQTGALADRVDNLRMVVLGDLGAPAAAATGNSMAYGNDPASGGYNTYPQQSYPPNNYGNANYNNGGGYQSYGGGNYGSANTGYPQPPNYGNSYGDPYGGGYSGGYGGTPIASSQSTYGGNGGYYPPAGGASVSASGAPTPDMLAAISEVEKEVIGQTFPSEPLNTRLDRVENKVFHTTSPEMSNEDRIQRVIAVSSAGGAPESRKTKTKHAIQTLLPIILTILPLVLL